jgi:hypothetical protein
MEIVVVAIITGVAAAFVLRRAVRVLRSARAPGQTSCGDCDTCSNQPADAQLVQLRTSRRGGRRAPARVMLGLIAAGLLASTPARASDTVETWDVGATNVDFYLGFFGLNADGGGSFGDIMLGYGIVERFSAYLGTTLTSDEHLGNGATEAYLGIFGTVIDSAHVDLDVLLQVMSGAGEFALTPALELNVDADPDMRSWGAYLRTHLPVHGRPTHPVTMASDTTYHVGLTLGAYRALGDRHQLLIEYQVDLHPDPIPEQPGIELGAVAIGYNLRLTDSLELINEVYAEVAPAAGERIGYGIMTGFIASFPPTR